MCQIKGLTPQVAKERLIHSCCSKCHQNPLMRGVKCTEDFRKNGCIIVHSYVNKQLQSLQKS